MMNAADAAGARIKRRKTSTLRMNRRMHKLWPAFVRGKKMRCPLESAREHRDPTLHNGYILGILNGDRPADSALAEREYPPEATDS